MAAQSAGTYDPIPAEFYEPVYSQVNHEPVQSNPTHKFDYCIKFRSRDSMELQQNRQPTSKTVVYINVMDNDDTRQIMANWWFIHRGTRYDVVGINPVSYLDHELQLICNTTGFSS